MFVISGPSGVGKDAVLKRLQQRRPDLYFVVTATSRRVRGIIIIIIIIISCCCCGL